MELIRIEKKNGQNFVSSLKEIYLAAGMDGSNWSRWYVKNVEENMFFTEGQEYQLFVTKTNGRDMKDIACTLDMAKHLIMQMSTEKAFAYRQYLIDYENKIKLPGTYKEALLALVAAEEIKEQQQLLITEQTEYIELAKPKVEVYDAIIKTEGNYSFKYVAGLLGVSKSEFVRKLKWLRIISETNEPFYEYRITKQYFRTFFSKNWYVTPEGIIFLTKKFKTMDDNKAW